jgi:trans-aconitate methyltransferase
LRVAAIPLDPVIASGAAADGVEMFYDDLDDFRSERPFDCVLCSNILHLAPKPVKLLSLMHSFMHGSSTLIIQTPNMTSLRAIRGRLKNRPLIPFDDYTAMGTHFSSARSIRKWCSKAGFRIEKISKIVPHPTDGRAGLASAIAGHLPTLFLSPFANSIVVTATGKVK